MRRAAAVVKAVAQTIVENGLAAYYRTRSAMSAQPEASSETLEKLAIARGLVTLDELDARTAEYIFSAHHEHED